MRSSCVRQSVSCTKSRESRQPGRTLTNSSRKTLVLSSRSICSRAAVPIFFSVASLLADQDGLLPFALAIDRRRNARQPAAFFVLLDQHRGRVRHFLLGGQQHLLADQFGHQKALGLVGDLVLGEISRPFGKRLDHGVQQGVQTLALHGRDGNDLGEIVPLFVFGDQRQQPLLVQLVNLVQQQEARLAALLHDVEHELVAGAELLRWHPR